MSSPSNQVLSAKSTGAVIPDKYLNLPGVQPCYRPPDPSQLRMFLHGPVGQGKSTFICSIPRTMIFDFERKTTAVRYRAKDSVIVHEQSADAYDSILDMLEQDAQSGSRPFDRVVFDPITSYVMLQRQFLTELYRKEGLLKGPGDITTYKMEGSGWDLLNQQVIGRICRLQNLGYSWAATVHMMPSWKRVKNQDLMVWESHLNSGIRSFFWKDAEYSGSIERTQTPLPVNQKTATVGGRKVALSSTSDIRYRNDFWLMLQSHDPKLPVRQHVPLPDAPIPLPEGRGWESFCDIYLKAVEAHRKIDPQAA